MTHQQSIKTAVGLILAGSAIEAVSIVCTTPLTFIAFITLGVPLIVAGIILYLRVVWKTLVWKGAL